MKSIIRSAIGLVSGLLMCSGAYGAAQLNVMPSVPVVMAPAGSSVLVEAVVTNPTPNSVFINSVSSDVTNAFATGNLFDEFRAAVPDSLLPGESWEGPIARLTIAPDAPVSSLHRITVFISGGDHPYDAQGLSAFTFALNDEAAEVGVPQAPEAVASGILRASPNPARGPAEIAFTLASPGDVDVQVYDVRGTSIRTLLHGPRGAGTQSVTWDGRTNGGDRAHPGIYFVKLRTQDGERKTKVVRIE
jgi:hypothetical protein